jgi:hypothetical protein
MNDKFPVIYQKMSTRFSHWWCLSSTGTYTISLPTIGPSCIDFGPVKVYPDGRVERTPNFTTDEEAAKSFWRAVEMFMPLMEGK